MINTSQPQNKKQLPTAYVMKFSVRGKPSVRFTYSSYDQCYSGLLVLLQQTTTQADGIARFYHMGELKSSHFGDDAGSLECTSLTNSNESLHTEDISSLSCVAYWCGQQSVVSLFDAGPLAIQ